MSEVKSSKIKGFLVGQAIVAFIGAILLLFGSFAGYYWRDYYNHIDTWGDIYFGAGFFSSVLILIGVSGLLIALYSAIKLLKEKNPSKKDVKKYSEMGFKGGLITTILSATGGFIFAISNIIDETQSWWLDDGFYGSLIAGILIIFFTKQILQRVKDNH